MRWGWVAAALAVSVGCTRHFLEVREEAVWLYLRAPGAREVLLIAAADSLEKIPAESVGLGLWRARREGRSAFRYSFLVDGEPRLPACPLRERDDFGSWNCVFDPHASRSR